MTENNGATYEFKETDLDSFELVITCEPSGRVMQTMVRQAQKALRAKTGQFPQEGKIEELLDSYVFPEQYLRYIYTVSKPLVKQVFADIEKDGVVVIIRDEPKKITYFKNLEGKWLIQIEVTGTHHKK